MQLARIEVRNIRSYAQATLDLESGTTLLVGDVGSGKTSLLYAVEMALFGTAEIDATYLVRHGATEASVLVALTEGEHRYEIKRVFRRVRRKGRETLEPGALSFRQDGATTSYSATELRQQVIALLGFRDNPNPRAHSDLWRWAVYVPQERMREILAAEPMERLETIRKALGVERYRIAAENAKEVARDLRRTSTTLRAQAATLREFSEALEDAVAEVRRLEGERVEVERELNAADRELATAREIARNVELRVEAFGADRQRLADLARDDARDRLALEELARRKAHRAQELARGTSDLEILVALASEEPARKEASQAADRGLARLREIVEVTSVAGARLAAARSLETARSQEVTRDRGEASRATAEVTRAETALEETSGIADSAPSPPTERSLDEIDRALEGQRRGEQSASEQVAVARRSLEELRTLVEGGVCPRCHQSVRAADFTQHETEANGLLASAEQRRAAVSEERTRWEELRRTRAAYESDRTLWEAMSRRRADAEASVGLAREALHRAERQLAEAVAAHAAAEAAVAPLVGPATGLEESRRQVTSAERLTESARARHEEARRASERRSDLAERLELLGGEGRRETAEAASLELRQDERKEEVRSLKERLATEPAAVQQRTAAHGVLGAREAERNRLSEQRGRLSGLCDSALLRQHRAEAAQIERGRITHLAERTDSKAEWLAHAFHDAVLTMERRVLEHAQVDFEQTFRAYFAALVDDPDLVAVTDSTFSPSAEIRGVETPAEALSGGERTSLALAYRLALSRVVRSLGSLRFDALLLDEPTDGFSPEQVLSMGQLLEELRLPQVVLVSHERELESIADRVVQVEKEDGLSVLRGPGTGGPPSDPASAD